MNIANVKINSKVLTNLETLMIHHSKEGYLKWNSEGFNRYLIKK